MKKDSTTPPDEPAAETTNEQAAPVDTPPAPAQTAGPIVRTDMQAHLKALTDQMIDAPPVPTDADWDRMATRQEMSIPDAWRRTEYIYAAKAIRGLDRNLPANGGFWLVVTRNNHSHIPSAAFDDATGAIVFGDTVLCFASRKWKDYHQKKIHDTFSTAKKEGEKEKKFYDQSGKEVAVMTRDVPKKGKDYGAAPGTGRMAIQDAGTDFGPPRE